MPSRLAWVAAGFAVAAAAAVRALRERRPGGTTEPPASPDERAAALRSKIAESRALVDERERFEGAETTVDAAEPVLGDPDERRRAVHAEGRAAAERMRRADGQTSDEDRSRKPIG